MNILHHVKMSVTAY